MVRRLVRGVLSLALAAGTLTLGTCTMFTDSLFPWYLPGVTASLDLSPWIDSGLVPDDMSAADWWLDLAALRDSGGEDTLFIAAGGYRGNRLIVLDADLSLAGTLDDNPDLGRRALVDANGDFVIGRQILVDPLPTATGTTPGDQNGAAFSDGLSNYLVWIDNGLSPAQLRFERYGGAWTSPVSGMVCLSATDPGSRWEMSAAAYDPQRPAGQEVVLLLRKWGSEDEPSSLRVVYMPIADFQSTLFTDAEAVGDPAIDGYPGFTISEVDGERAYYTRKGIVVQEYDERAWLYRSGGGRLALDFRSRHEFEAAYDVDGERFYCIDKNERILFKGRTGW
jgi:hypothetical protein